MTATPARAYWYRSKKAPVDGRKTGDVAVAAVLARRLIMWMASTGPKR
jgi:hypothetical protein